jgi:hypothetical protein
LELTPIVAKKTAALGSVTRVTSIRGEMTRPWAEKIVAFLSLSAKASNAPTACKKVSNPPFSVAKWNLRLVF